MVVVDSHPRRVASEPLKAHAPTQVVDFAVRGYGDSLFVDVFDAQRIDFGFLETQHRSSSSNNAEDPLPDSLFEPIHRRAERLERSIRNSEKGRAQHEKDQITRLLEGLQGHDWLRVMGVSGITETRKSMVRPLRRSLKRPSCGMRFSAMSSSDMTLMRLMMVWWCRLSIGSIAW